MAISVKSTGMVLVAATATDTGRKVTSKLQLRNAAMKVAAFSFVRSTVALPNGLWKNRSQPQRHEDTENTEALEGKERDGCWRFLLR